MGTKTTTTSFTPQQSAAKAGAELSYQEPAWLKEITPYIVKFYKKALTNASYPFSVPEKALKEAINYLGGIAIEKVAQVTADPYDLFQIPYKDIMESMYQSIVNWGQNYQAQKYEISPPETKIATSERKALAGFMPEMKEHAQQLSQGKGYTMDEMGAMFRDTLSGIAKNYQQRVDATRRISSADPRLRSAALIDMEIARGGWVQDAADQNVARQAQMRIQSEFFGADQLLKLAQTATAEETTANQMQFYANQLGLQKDQLRINAQQVAAEIGQRGEQLKMQALGMAATGATALGELAKFQQSQWLAEQNLKTTKQQIEMEKLQQLLGTVGIAQSMFQYGRDYPLRAAGGAADFASAGMQAALGRYQADISKYAGQTQAAYNPWASVLGGGLSALGSIGGVVLGNYTSPFRGFDWLGTK